MNIIGNIIQFDDIHSRLNEYDLAEAERAEIVNIIEETLFHRFLDLVLTDLSIEDRVFVLEKISAGDHITIIEFIKEKKPDASDVITRELGLLKQELLAELT